MKKVLVMGSGGREHALAKKFQASPQVSAVFVAPGNDGIATEFETFPSGDFSQIYGFVLAHNIDLVFVGNEQFLADGIVDFLSAKGVTVIGPTRAAARIESSKVFCKDLLRSSGVNTAVYESFTDESAAIAYLQSQSFPVVVKADGLAAGKGVIIAETKAEAEKCVREILAGELFGDAGNSLIIEEFLVGDEASIFAFCDGENFVSTVFAQDHKKAFDGDKGLNTGGMGAFAPVQKFAHLKEKVDATIFAPVLQAMKKEGCPFTGVLFAGLMIAGESVKVIEFNCRFGDPETQVILPLLENDLYKICVAIAEKKISQHSLVWHSKSALCIVLASKGYPETFEKGHPVNIPAELLTDQSLQICFAGIKNEGGTFVNSGGRVISLTCIEDSLEKASKYGYQKASEIKSDILRYRGDLGKLEIRN